MLYDSEQADEGRFMTQLQSYIHQISGRGSLEYELSHVPWFSNWAEEL